MSPLPSNLADTPASACAARAAAREGRSWESSPCANLGGEPPAALLPSIAEAHHSEVEVVEVVPGDSGDWSGSGFPAEAAEGGRTRGGRTGP